MKTRIIGRIIERYSLFTRGVVIVAPKVTHKAHSG